MLFGEFSQTNRPDSHSRFVPSTQCLALLGVQVGKEFQFAEHAVSRLAVLVNGGHPRFVHTPLNVERDPRTEKTRCAFGA